MRMSKWDQEDLLLKEAVAEMIETYIDESVEHFLISRSRCMADDARYFYTPKELKEFKEKYRANGGKMEDLHIGSVKYGYDEFLCYEVCRKKYYNLFKASGKNVFYS